MLTAEMKLYVKEEGEKVRKETLRVFGTAAAIISLLSAFGIYQFIQTEIEKTMSTSTVEQIEKEAQVSADTAKAFADSTTRYWKTLAKNRLMENENQRSFRLGELLIVWGLGTMEKNTDWKEVTFPEAFADSSIGTSVIPTQDDKKNPPYAIVRNLSRASAEVRLTRRNSRWVGNIKEYTTEYKQFHYIAVGKAAEVVPRLTDLGN